MRKIRFLILYQLLNLPGGFEMVKVVHEVLDLPKRTSPCLFRLGEILALRRRTVVFPLQREVDYIVAVLLKQSARVEAHRLRPALVEVVDVNKKDFHLEKNKKLYYDCRQHSRQQEKSLNADKDIHRSVKNGLSGMRTISRMRH